MPCRQQSSRHYRQGGIVFAAAAPDHRFVSVCAPETQSSSRGSGEPKRREPVEVRVLDLGARCGCGESRFFPPHEPPFAADSRFTCAACARQWRYQELLDSIGEEATRRARASLRLLRAAGARRRSRD
jgi:hypothetical protein